MINGSTILIGFLLFFSLNHLLLADDDFIQEQRASLDVLTPEQAKNKRLELIAMSEQVLENLYKKHPKSKQEIENAYGYGVFKGFAVNLVFYVAGTGVGVVFDNKTKTPVFMNAIRGGTGPGIGYKIIHGIFIFENELVYNQFISTGVQISVAADASIKVAGIGAEASEAASLIPGVSYYQLTDSGLVIQANWGLTEFLRDPQLN